MFFYMSFFGVYESGKKADAVQETFLYIAFHSEGCSTSLLGDYDVECCGKCQRYKTAVTLE